MSTPSNEAPGYMRLLDAKLFAITTANGTNSLTIGAGPQMRGWVGGAVTAWSELEPISALLVASFVCVGENL